MKYSWTIALPFLLSLGAALAQATVTWLGGLHPSTPLALIVVTAALAVGDAIRAQLAIAQAKNPTPPPAAPATQSGQSPATPLGIDPTLVARLIEQVLRQSLEQPAAPAPG